MDILKFHGALKWLEFHPDHFEKIKKIESFFSKYCNDNGLVILPRFNGTYLSIRFCGLEVLQLNSNGNFLNPLFIDNNGKITRNTSSEITSISNIEIILDYFISQFIDNAIKTGYTKSKFPGSIIPGFSFEHYMETLILSDTECGRQTRKHLQLPFDNLSNIATQVPVIIKDDNKEKRTVQHIDIMSVDGNTISIIELKKDNDSRKALEELERYYKWATGTLPNAEPARGNIRAMINEGYFSLVNFTNKTYYRKVMVVVSDFFFSEFEGIDVYVLKPHWLLNAAKNQNLFN